MPSTALETRIARLESGDSDLAVHYTCNDCGATVLTEEAGLPGYPPATCTQGRPHSPNPAGPNVRVVWTD